MPEELRVVVACAALCVACFILAFLLWRTRKPRRREEPGNVMPELETLSPSVPVVTSSPAPAPVLAPGPARGPEPSSPAILYDEEEDDVDPTKIGAAARTRAWINPTIQKIVIDEDAVVDAPTQTEAMILVTATAQTDRGVRRKRNEDSILALNEDNLFVVADGMGGYRGGEIASQLAVSTIGRAFETQTFPGVAHDSIPRRGSELARAIQAANVAILERAEQERHLEGMGTTVCALRFSLKKQRFFVGHVGDSRTYRLRAGELRQLTADHTMKDHGVVGEGANHLSRAVGIWPTVPIDILLGKPEPGDVYLICSDGLTKMLKDDAIARILERQPKAELAVEELIAAANASGGKDNVSVVVVRVEAAPPS